MAVGDFYRDPVLIRAVCRCCGQSMKVPKNFTAPRGRCPRCGELILNPQGPLMKKNLEHASRDILSWLRLFELRYDELTLFLLSVSLILVGLVNLKVIVGCCAKLREYSIGQILSYGWLLALYGFFFMGGFIFSLYHVFTNRLKKPGEKAIMVFFAVITSAASGVAAAYYMYVEAIWADKCYLGVFPIWLFLSSIYLLIKYDANKDDEDIIADENASLGQVFSALVVLLIIFGLCYFMLKLNWAITLSICVTYTTGFSRAFRELIPVKTQERTAE